MSVEPRRPRLLAQNRKLRHLHGLSLRNLSFAPPKLLRAADDSDLIVQKNAHKLDPLGEAGGPLHSSRSSGNLRRDSLHSAADNNSSSRPQQQRRTSLSLAQWNLGARQKKLEEVVDTAVGDVFFTLHVAGETEPVYISEVKEKSAVCSILEEVVTLYLLIVPELRLSILQPGVFVLRRLENL